MNVEAFGIANGAATPEGAVTITPRPAAKRRPEATKPAIISAPLAASVEALAQDTEATLAKSLGVPLTSQGYDPALFVQSVQRIHDALVGVRDNLATRQAELDKMQQALEAREKAVQAREAQAAAALALAPLNAALGQRRGLWAILTGRR